MHRPLVTLPITLTLAVACALSICSVSGAADTTRVVRVGFVNPHSRMTAPAVSAFWDRLRELGYIEGQNLVLDARWADSQPDRLPELAADVIRRKPDVVVTWGALATIAAQNATSTVPLVAVGDMLGAGLVNSLARPGGNLTAVSLGFSNIAGKWLELLNEAVRRLSTVAVITNPENPLNRNLTSELQTIASARHLKLRIFEVRRLQGLEGAFAQAHRQAQAVLIMPDPIVIADPSRLIALAAKYRLPAVYPGSRRMAHEGGLMAYGPDFAVAWRRTADYVDKILKGTKPADLPIEEPPRYELVVNLRTAKALRLTIPASIMVRADEIVR